MNKRFERICSLFDAIVEPSQKRFRRIRHCDFSNIGEPEMIEDIEAIAIHIPKDKVEMFLDVFDDQRIKEFEIRSSIPAIEKAYNHYKMMIHMCG